MTARARIKVGPAALLLASKKLSRLSVQKNPPPITLEHRLFRLDGLHLVSYAQSGEFLGCIAFEAKLASGAK